MLCMYVCVCVCMYNETYVSYISYKDINESIRFVHTGMALGRCLPAPTTILNTPDAARSVATRACMYVCAHARNTTIRACMYVCAHMRT